MSNADRWIHLFGLQIILSPGYSKPLFTLWYFGLLISFLLVFPVILKWANRPTQALGIIFTQFFLIVILHQEFKLIDVRFFYYYWIFCVGSIIGRYPSSFTDLHIRTRALVASVIIFLGSSFILIFSQKPYYLELAFWHIVSANAFMLSFMVLAYYLATKVVNNSSVVKFSEYVSGGSFFLYIYHRPIWRVLLLPFPQPDRLLVFLIQFFIGTPLVIWISGRLQPLYENVFRKK